MDPRDALLLKDVARAGWLRVGVDHPESVAAHSWGVAVLALLTCPDHLDRARVLGMALVHDLPEVDVGDLTPHDGVDKAEKARREALAADRLFAGRPDLRALWQEYEDHQTDEARFVHALDRLDMGVQAQIYADRGIDTAEFLASARRGLPPELAQWLSR